MATIEQLLHDAYTHWDDGARLSRLGQEIHDRNRLDHAQRVLERAVELTPDDVDAWAHLSYAYFRALDDEKGRAVLRQGVESTGSDALKSTLVGFSEGEEAEGLRAELESSSDLGARAARISERFVAGEKDEALADLRQLIADHPGEDGPRETLLWLMIRAKHSNAIEGLDLHDEAIPIADAKIQKSPDRVSAWALKLMMLAAETDWDGVLETTAKALEVFPDEETVMQFRARAFREKDDADRAIQWYQRAIGAKPSFAGARIELAKLYEKQEKLELAEEVFRDLLVANPAYPFSPVSLALFLARREQWEEAERLMIDVWPSFPAFLRGAVLGNPDARPLLEREAVKAVVGAEAGVSVSDTFEALQREAVRFRDERDWEQFHLPKDLALGLGIEAGELGELFLWRTPEEVEAELQSESFRTRLAEEMADVQMFLLYLAEASGISLPDAVRAKLETDARKYPVDKAKGTAKKYTDL